MNILAKDRSALQDRYSLLEETFQSTSEALVDCTSHKDRLQISVNELNTHLEEESKKTCQTKSEIQELIKQLTVRYLYFAL